MAITPAPGYIVDPNNPNGVIRDTSIPTAPGGVPTVAPKAPSVKAPVASPTAVVSSQAGAKQYDVMADTAKKASDSMAAAQAAKEAARVANQGKPGFDVFGNPVAGTPLATGGADQTKTAMTPEEKIANQPGENMKFVYDNNGNQHQIDINAPVPQGYTTNNPKEAPNLPAVDTTTDGINSYKQFSDGSYGKFDATGAYAGPSSADEFNNNKAGQSLVKSINQVANGTYPLTPAQQAQIDGIKAVFATLIEQQKTANANLTGGTTVAQNLYGMGNTVIGMGAIKDSVDKGVAKIADLDAKLVSTVAQMTDAFNKENMAMLKDAYDVYNTTVKEKQAEIDTIHKAATEALDKSRQYQLDVQKLQEQMKKDEASLSIEERKVRNEESAAAFDKWYKTEEIKIKKSQYNLGLDDNGNPTHQVVSIGADGKPNPTDQAAFLKNLLPATATLVKGLSDYSIDPKNASNRSDRRLQLIALAKQYDPNYSDMNYPSVLKKKEEYNSGKTFQTITSLNTSINHAAELAKDFVKLPNADITKFNTLKDWYSQNVGKGDVTKVSNDLQALKNEIIKTIKGAGATDQEISTIDKTIDVNSSPAQFKAFIESSMNLLGGRLSALQEGYVDPQGHPIPNAPQTLLNPSTKTMMSKFKNAGYDIDVPGVLYTDPAAYIKYGGGSQQALDSAREMLKSAGLPTTPENILQAAQELNK